MYCLDWADEKEGTMWQEKALKLVLVLVGLLFTAAIYPLILMAKEDSALAMMMSLYATLGIFLLLASPNPSAHRSLIAFTAWASFAPPSIIASAAISWFHRSQRTDRFGCVRRYRRNPDRTGSGKEASQTSFYRGGVKLAPLVLDTTNAASAAVFSSCVHGEPTIFPSSEMCCRTEGAP